MFSGIQEILLILLIIIAILFVPRLMSKRQPSATAGTTGRKQSTILSGRIRLAVIFSAVWLLLATAYYEPWLIQSVRPFLYFGVGPVVLLWGGIWIFSGFKNYRS